MFKLKINGNKFLRLTLIISVILVVILIIYTVYSIINDAKNEGKINENNEILVTEIASNEYTNFLKNCHENIDDYINMNVKITGYIYRLPTFNDNQFVLARTMILDSNNTAVVVGILSQCESASNYKDGEWVTITGTITEGYYNGTMPIVNITDIFKCDTPEEEYVYPPSTNQVI